MEMKTLLEFWFRLSQWKPSSAFMFCPQNNCRWSNVEARLHYLYCRQFKGICSPLPQFVNFVVTIPACTAFPRLQRQREPSLFNTTVPSGASGFPRAVRFHAAHAWRWTAVQVPPASQMRVGSGGVRAMAERNLHVLKTFAVPMSGSLSAEGRVQVVCTNKVEQGVDPTHWTKKSEWGKQWVLSLPGRFFGEARKVHKKEFSLEVHIQLPYR